MGAESTSRLASLIKEIDMLPGAVVKLRSEISDMKARCAQLEGEIAKVQGEIEARGKEQSQYGSLIDKMNRLIEGASLDALEQDLEPTGSTAEEDDAGVEEAERFAGYGGGGDEADLAGELQEPEEGEPAVDSWVEEKSTAGEARFETPSGMIGQVEEITYLLDDERESTEGPEQDLVERPIEDFEDSGFEKDFDLARALKDYSKRKNKGSIWKKIKSGKKKKKS